MDIISIDPGKDYFAWAEFIDKQLTRCNKEKIDNLGGMGKPINLYYAIIELPRVYRHSKGDPNDLIDVAVTCGRLAHAFRKSCEAGIDLSEEVRGLWRRESR